MRYDVVIIGGGLAGLVAANFLGGCHRRILLLEREKRLGGRAKTDKVDQYYFNLGPHALYKKGKAKQILDELGVRIEGQSPDTGGILYDGRRRLQAPFSPKGILTTKLLNWRERMEWLKVILQLGKQKISDIGPVTYQDWVRNTTDNPKIQSILYTIGRLSTYCNAPELTDARVIVNQLQSAFKGVTYLDSGWQKMVDQLYEKAKSKGVVIQKGSFVKQIIPKDDHEFLLEVGNQQIFAEQVLYTGEPSKLNNLIDCINDDITPVKAAVLDVALNHLPKPKLTFAMSLEESYYYALHSKYAQLSEQSKGYVLHVMKYLHPEENNTTKQLKVELESFLDIVQPGWRQFLETSRFFPNLTVNQRLPEVCQNQSINDPETTVPNLFIAGDWASNESILSEASISTGKNAAQAMMNKWQVSL
ncbi:phytoene desaturase family protein [Aquisalibacillus elongatus]|uniref:Phytoene dehydrogenase-like protein n=1 Tax=Aquisalibacillus elongatus TaxID=485577 RepID=A0A3N5B7U2_9BACI|nr:FAD-dependent oxidoreductase [Aquisalibacillus elongatus]RPF53403.1 phytoene dehydrogenase-like protein [Aquisalibacillus elongatus]